MCTFSSRISWQPFDVTHFTMNNKCGDIILSWYDNLIWDMLKVCSKVPTQYTRLSGKSFCKILKDYINTSFVSNLKERRHGEESLKASMIWRVNSPYFIFCCVLSILWQQVLQATARMTSRLHLPTYNHLTHPLFFKEIVSIFHSQRPTAANKAQEAVIYWYLYTNRVNIKWWQQQAMVTIQCAI